MVELAALTWMAEALKKILGVWVLGVNAGPYAPLVERGMLGLNRVRFCRVLFTSCGALLASALADSTMLMLFCVGGARCGALAANMGAQLAEIAVVR